MGWRETISDSLPPPRDDEPGDLRGDIIDELADHLTCALNRELIRTPDETAARRNVLQRFGNPAAIARKLWLAGMKERIMKDRIFLVVTLLVLTVLIASVVMPWAAQQNKINAEILEQLKNLSRPAPPAATQAVAVESSALSNWATGRVKLLKGGEGGRPAEGIRIHLKGKPFPDNDEESLDATTDAEGVASFGPIQPGRYEVTYSMPGFHLLTNKITLYPGSGEFIMPYPPEQAYGRLEMKLEGDEELPDHEYLFYVGIAIASPDPSLHGMLPGISYEYLLDPIYLEPSLGHYEFLRVRQTRWGCLLGNPKAIEGPVNFPIGRFRITRIHAFRHIPGLHDSDFKNPSEHKLWWSVGKADTGGQAGEFIFEVSAGKTTQVKVRVPSELVDQIKEVWEEEQKFDPRYRADCEWRHVFVQLLEAKRIAVGEPAENRVRLPADPREAQLRSIEKRIDARVESSEDERH